MTIRFGDCELHVEARELRRSRVAVHLEPQVFDLLAYLIAHRERAVSRDEIIKEVWHGRIISDATLSSRINAVRQAIGDTGKNQKYIRTLPRRGFRFVGELTAEATSALSNRYTVPSQQITFCRTRDGVNLAVATSGKGLPIVKTGTWLTNVERDWQSPLWSPLFSSLSSEFQLVRYDPRGCGLSDWTVPEISLEAFVEDLETVVDSLGLERFALFGLSQGAAVSITYAARHPERVMRLILSGGFPLGWRKRGNPAEIAAREAILTLMQQGWGQDNPAFRLLYDQRMWPDATAEQRSWLNEMQRASTSPENAIRIHRTFGDFTVAALLERIAVPTLVLHSRNDVTQPLENGLMLAHAIKKSRFVEIDSRNHIPLSHEKAWPRYINEVCAFLNENK
jgi:pimeloyl-ACP methyl ester carboxylesterase/DNA-binding winged helix-turn-helix (wHTH) protein